MEFEHFCDRSEWFQPESRADPRFRASSNEELDLWDFVHIARKHRENGRGRLFVFALVKGINDDKGSNVGSFEGTDDEFLHLRTKGFSPDIRAPP